MGWVPGRPGVRDPRASPRSSDCIGSDAWRGRWPVRSERRIVQPSAARHGHSPAESITFVSGAACGNASRPRSRPCPSTEAAASRSRARCHPLPSVQRWVELPWALARKYPNAGHEWPWQGVFPAPRIYLDRVTGQRRRHHLHESVLQRAVRTAALRADTAKRVSCMTRSTPGRRAPASDRIGQFRLARARSARRGNVTWRCSELNLLLEVIVRAGAIRRRSQRHRLSMVPSTSR